MNWKTLYLLKTEKISDEEELDAEINKSALINLVEGALVEAVRKGASDIHFHTLQRSSYRNLYEN